MPQERDARGRFIKAAEPLFEPKDTEEALDSPEMTAALMALAEEAAAYWRDLAPVESGAYRDSIQAVQYGNDVFVEATDYKAHWIEYGTVDTPEYAVRAKTEMHFNEGVL